MSALSPLKRVGDVQNCPSISIWDPSGGCKRGKQEFVFPAERSDRVLLGLWHGLYISDLYVDRKMERAEDDCDNGRVTVHLIQVSRGPSLGTYKKGRQAWPWGYCPLISALP